MSSSPSPLLELECLCKSFAGTTALDDVTLHVGAAEALGIVGENGAGKSTLIKILSGVLTPDRGVVKWRGDPIVVRNPAAAKSLGIATIHQELAYFSRLSVAENLLLGEPWPRYWWRGVNWRRLRQQGEDVCRKFGLELDVRRRFADLSSAAKQEIAIVRALSRQARLLILDEPTASLSDAEVERLVEQLQGAQSRGVALIYISHRLEEVKRLSDRIAVLRDGSLVAMHRKAEVTTERLVLDMLGRSRSTEARSERGEAGSGMEAGGEGSGDRRMRGAGRPSGGLCGRDGGDSLDATGAGERSADEALRVEGLTCEPFFRGVSFDLRAGEILSLAGLVGAGRSEVARTILGLYQAQSGRMWLLRRAWRPRDCADSRAHGLVYLPEERKRQALGLDLSLMHNLSIGYLDQLSRCGYLPRRTEERLADAAIARHSIRCRDRNQVAGTLSGGNQQKAVIARCLGRDPGVLLLDEPTRGVDVAAKAEIHSTVRALAAAGKAVLLISSDLPEVIALSDRILVLREGNVVKELPPNERSEENLLKAASGLSDSRHI